MESVKILAIGSFLFLASSSASLHAMDQQINPSKEILLELHYMDIGKGFCGRTINDTRAMRSGAKNFWYNRVFTINQLEQEDIDAVKTYMGDADFSWWVLDQQPEISAFLEKNGFVVCDSEPAMSVDLTNYDSKNISRKLSPKYESLKKDLTIKKVDTEDDIDEWVTTSAQGFAIPLDDHAQFIQYLLDKGNQNTYSFYTGYFQGIPASTCLMIEHKAQKLATLHLVSTIPDFRQNMLATLLSLSAMADTKADGCNQMILLSSPIAHQLYLDIGFKDYCTYKIYGLQKQDPLTPSWKYDDVIDAYAQFDAQDDILYFKRRKSDV